MKSLMLLLESVLDDIGTQCCASTDLDLKTIKARVVDEGLSFLTITLSNYGKDFEKSLDQGYIGSDQFAGFSRSGGLPHLFKGFLCLIFNSSSGRLLDTPSIDSIRCLRQITLMWSKIEVECAPKRISAAIDKYIECEKDVRSADTTFSGNIQENFGRVSALLWSECFTLVDSDIYNGNILPRHGPGATADKLKGNQKWNQSVWTQRLEDVFPHGEHLISSWTLYLEKLGHIEILEPGSEIPVKVITVPKTLKTPRIIAVEPTAMQYMQQGILRSIEKALLSTTNGDNLIRSNSQVPNQVLALRGSLDGTLATLDLSEASDRVSNQHVRYMLRNHPHFLEAVDATRSRKADVPGYGVKRLAKFASMGSALCFPMEAFVFSTVVFMGIEKVLNRHLTKKDIKSFFGRVRIYGDDIIVPVEYARSVVEELESFGFRVNSSKSFWTGRFRESCGKDYYAGHDVSLTRVRRLIPTQQKQTDEIVSAVSLRNQLYLAGYWRAVRYLDQVIERLIPFPAGLDTSPGLVKMSFLGFDQERFHPTLQKPLVKAAVVVPKRRVSILDDYGALNKFFHKDSDLPVIDERHLQFAGRPVSVDIRHRWICPF